MTITPFSNNPYIIVKAKELNPGYSDTLVKIQKLKREMVEASLVGPGLSCAWAAVTRQNPLHSPVSIAFLLLSVGCVANRALQHYRIHKYANLSLLTDKIGPTKDSDTNKKLKEIFETNNDITIRYNQDGISIFPSFFPTFSSKSAADQAKDRISSMERVVIPSIALDNNASRLVNTSMDRWIARLMVPISVFNLVIIAMESTQNKKNKPWKRADDCVVAASSMYNIYDYLSGPSVDTARSNLTNYLGQSSSVHDLFQRTLDRNMLFSGSMSFLKEWARDNTSLAVRVDRFGSLIFYQKKEFSFGGPYPVHRFPKSQ